MAALEHILIQSPPHLDLLFLEQSLNSLIQEHWEYLELIKDNCPPELLKHRKKVAYQYELLLLAICKCNRS